MNDLQMYHNFKCALMTPQTVFHKRLLYLTFLALVLAGGLLSRHYSSYLPSSLNLVLGDFLWALAVFIAVRVVLIRSSINTAAVSALIFSFVIEFSQRYQASWINGIRANRLGGLVLGYGFLWSDLLAYSAGIGFGLLAEMAVVFTWSKGRHRVRS